MNAPLISVIVPCFNAARYLGEAIDSILAQDVRGVEVIVIDDGSTDDSARVASGYEGVVVVRQSNQGVGSARNRGLSLATGARVAFLDADDIWAPGKLEAQLRVLESDPDIDVVYGRIEEFISDDLSPAQRREVTARPGRPAARLPSTVLMTRQAADIVGEFEAGETGGEAIDWALKLAEAGLTTALADGALVYRRIHASNNGRRLRDVQRGAYLHALKRSLDRRRAAEGAGQ